MNCNQYEKLSFFDQILATLFYKVEGHQYIIYDFDVLVWTRESSYHDKNSFAESTVHLKCKECGHQKRIDGSPYRKEILTRMRKEGEVFKSTSILEQVSK